ncbi:hypothetical protein TNCV_1740431 [Trichonephila clavipes]|uniref:Uncharacterized protein n=1 Tax=Trichonephila clavipes TaxID=2585209 RepID=A0A8X6RBV0_TRICX|nr:hypothetical protein TNCV_1740431 [Trichonephila clavipes]
MPKSHTGVEGPESKQRTMTSKPCALSPTHKENHMCHYGFTVFQVATDSPSINPPIPTDLVSPTHLTVLSDSRRMIAEHLDVRPALKGFGYAVEIYQRAPVLMA